VKKKFSELNFYDMLDIKPDAVVFEIRHAYNTALQIYQPGSLASYSFFTEEERREILTLLEKAYATLSQEQSRKDYDEELIRRGEIQAKGETRSADKKPVGIFDISRSPAARSALTGNEELKGKIRQSAELDAILNQKSICGADLKKIRTELDVVLEQIAEETRVRLDHLRSIEEDNVSRLPAPVFLKGFVKSYLKCLCLEPVEELSARYMDTISRLPRR
jgi:DnaJ-class molecular chaperone